jgi:hypothetical protein
MATRFRFNRKNSESIVVEGERIDVRGCILTVVDEHGQPLASFAESDLIVWWQLQESGSASPVNAH